MPRFVKMAERYPYMTVYSPPSAERTEVTAETLRKRRWRRRPRNPLVVQVWRGANGERGRPRNLPSAQAMSKGKRLQKIEKAAAERVAGSRRASSTENP